MKNHVFAWYRLSEQTFILEVQFVAHPGFVETAYKAVSEKLGLFYQKM